MGGEIGEVYAFKPFDPDAIREYSGSLFTDEEAAPERCTARAIMYNTFMLAAVIARIVKAHAVGENLPLEGIVKAIDTHSLIIR